MMVRSPERSRLPLLVRRRVPWVERLRQRVTRVVVPLLRGKTGADGGRQRLKSRLLVAERRFDRGSAQARGPGVRGDCRRPASGEGRGDAARVRCCDPLARGQMSRSCRGSSPTWPRRPAVPPGRRPHDGPPGLARSLLPSPASGRAPRAHGDTSAPRSSASSRAAIRCRSAGEAAVMCATRRASLCTAGDESLSSMARAVDEPAASSSDWRR